MKNLSALFPVGFFTGLYLLVASLFAVQTQNWEFVFYIAVVVLIAIAAVAVHIRVGLSKGVLWCLSIWGLLHMVGGLVALPDGWAFHGTKAVFYSWWIIPTLLKFDQVVHAYGFGVATWVCWQVLRSTFAVKRPTIGLLIFCMLGGMGLGALNEVVEFVATLILPDTNVGDYANTGWDLVANMAGTIIAATSIYMGSQRP